MKVGDRVRIARDEDRFPSKGTWPPFRGKTGTVVEINEDRQRPHLTEYGVSFGKVTEAPGSRRLVTGSVHGRLRRHWPQPGATPCVAAFGHRTHRG